MATLKNYYKLNVHKAQMHLADVMSTLVWALLYSVLSSMFNGETGRDITGKESVPVICNVLHLDRKNNT